MILLVFHSRYCSSFYHSSFLVIGLTEVMKLKNREKSLDKKKTKAEFAEGKKKNLADSDKQSFEQVDLPVASSFSLAR